MSSTLICTMGTFSLFAELQYVTAHHEVFGLKAGESYSYCKLCDMKTCQWSHRGDMFWQEGGQRCGPFWTSTPKCVMCQSSTPAFLRASQPCNVRGTRNIRGTTLSLAPTESHRTFSYKSMPWWHCCKCQTWAVIGPCLAILAMLPCKTELPIEMEWPQIHTKKKKTWWSWS